MTKEEAMKQAIADCKKSLESAEKDYNNAKAHLLRAYNKAVKSAGEDYNKSMDDAYDIYHESRKAIKKEYGQ